MAALAAAVEELADSLPGSRATLLIGVMGDKEVAAMLEALLRADALAHGRCLVTEVPDTDRSLPADALAQAWQAATGRPPDDVCADADVALERGLALARAEGGILVVAGSLYLVGHVRGRLLPDEAQA
jgi:folylpolyglutamate synthase/dihydropteroate synthase